MGAIASAAVNLPVVIPRMLRSTSGAWTGGLHLRSQDLDLRDRLGPAVSGVAPLPYERSVVLAHLRTGNGGRIGDINMSARSDLVERAHSGFACAEVILRDLDVWVTQDLHLRAEQVSSRCLVSKDSGGFSGDVDLLLCKATLHVEGIGPVHLPPRAGPNTRIRPDLLEPIGLRLMLNEQAGAAAPFHHTLRSVAFRLTFQEARLGGESFCGDLEIAVTQATLEERVTLGGGGHVVSLR